MVKFKSLWASHPTIKGDGVPCKTKSVKNFDNQCAIRVGAALARCGVDTKEIPGARHCWQHDSGEGHVLSAEELANGLEKVIIPGVQKVIKHTPEKFLESTKGVTGIVFFKDYWYRSTDQQGSPSGDHIDLWNGSRLTDWATWARFHLRIRGYGMHTLSDDVSDFLASKEIRFWRVI